MKTIGVIFALALLTMAGGWYSDSVFRGGEIAAPPADAVAVGVADAARR